MRRLATRQASEGEAYPSRAQKNFSTARAEVQAMGSAASKIAYLREQIELRVLGFGWSDLSTAWKKQGESTDESITRLLAHLSTVITEERSRPMPVEPPLPDFRAKSLKQLGQPTEDAEELAKTALCSPEQLAAAIAAEHARREEAGFSDSVQAVQPQHPPDLDNDLVGAQLEICWHYVSTEDGKTKVPIWCPARVVRVADGETDMGRNNQPLSSSARALAPRGMLLLEWDADPDRGETESTTCWYLLDPRKWNKDNTHRGWRFHPAELKARRARSGSAKGKARA
mmetsp:Transcript_1248/g.3086  ORF Transcript_1248/g.3086 Transcript_1248/m.3086 type:complete len:285 (-) Transcript_1248:351-1205(-)